LIIGIALATLSGCVALRVAYNNGPQLAWWRLDGYLDFNREQTPAAKQAIDRFFDWHRSTQLGSYAAFLGTAQQAVLEPTTPAAVCRYSEQVRGKLDGAIDKAIVHGAELLPGLGERQFKALEARYAKGNEEMRSDFLQPDPADRLRKSFDRALERAEQLYGRLDEAQKSVIKAGVAASPFDPQAWLAERLRRQRDVVQTLRKLNADKADLDTRIAAMRTLNDRVEHSPDPAYRAYELKLVDYNCAFAAQVHNATTPAQRQKARDNLKGWEEDLRALVAGPTASN
jgi:hypothetical protein